jgi:hypothetical protein
MDEQRLQGLVEEADRLLTADPSHFDPVYFNQPPGQYVRAAEECLGEEAPWHQVAYLAHAIKDEEEASLYF